MLLKELLDALFRETAHKVILITHRPDVSLKIGGFLGEASMQEAIYNPILDLLAHHKPDTIGH